MKFLHLILSILFFNSFAKANDSSIIFINQAKVLQNKGLHFEAMRAFEKSTKYAKPTADVFFMMATSADSMKKVDKMKMYYEQAYLKEPTNQLYMQKASTTYYNFTQYAKVIEILEKAKPFKNSNKMLGISYYKIEQYKKAVATLKDCEEAECYYYMARTYEDNNDMNNAGIYYVKCAESVGVKPKWMYDAGFAAFNGEDYKKAAKYLEKSFKDGVSFNTEMKMLLLKSYMAIDKVDEAEQMLKPILEASIKQEEIYNEIGTHLYEIKKYDRAIAYFEKAYKINNKDAMALYKAGLCFIAKGNKNQGSNMCDKAIAMDPRLQSLRSKTNGGSPFGL